LRQATHSLQPRIFSSHGLRSQELVARIIGEVESG
jgi:hypothetical protein